MLDRLIGGVLFVLPFWLNIFLKFKEQPPTKQKSNNKKEANYGGVFCCLFVVGVCLFLNKNIWSRTPWPGIWFLVSSYSIPKSQFVFASICILSYVCSKTCCHFPSTNFSVRFTLARSTGHDPAVVITTAMSLSNRFQHVPLGPSAKYPCPILSGFFTFSPITLIKYWWHVQLQDTFLNLREIPTWSEFRSVEQIQPCSCTT